MKKIFTAALLVTTVGTVNSAVAEPAFFAGAGFGSSTLSWESKDSDGDNYSGTENSTGLYLRAGMNTSNTRFYGTYSTNDFNGVDQVALSGSLDKIIPLESAISLYAGATLGYTSFDGGYIDDAGLLFGFQAGALFEVDKNINIDAGFAYKRTTVEAGYEEEFFNEMFVETTTLESITTFKVGVDLSF